MRRALALAALFLLLGLPARGDELRGAIDSLPLDAIEDYARESGAALDVRAFLLRLTGGSAAEEAPALLEALRDMLMQAAREAFPSLLALTAPALMWALVRQIAGSGRLGEAGALVCYLSEASLLIAMFSEQAAAARAAIERVAGLIERFHPLMSALFSSTGAAAAWRRR